MKRTLLIFLLTLSGFIVRAQQPAPQKLKDPDSAIQLDPPIRISKPDSQQIFTAVEHEPEFKGGVKVFYKYLQESLHYPAIAKKNNIQGKVFLSFIVEKDGSITNVKIARGLSKEIDAEAMRVIQASPKWIPGTQNGKAVRVAYVMPLSFTLAN